MTVVEALVPGGKATPSPPLGPALGPLGVNVKAIIDKINQETKVFNGMNVPIKIIIDDKKQFTIQVGTPPTSSLIKKEIGIELGSGTPSEKFVGNITIKQTVTIAKMKRKDSLSKTLKNGAKEVVGTCGTLGVTVEGMRAKDAIVAINSGKFDSEFSQ
jgi:large subunit ribosomal protein L11